MTDQSYIGDYVELRGESGARMVWHDFQFLDNTVKFSVDIILDWSSARGSVEIGREKWSNFQGVLADLGLSGIDNMAFEPEYGLFNVELVLNKQSGIIAISGTIGKSIYEGGRLLFEFESYVTDLERFQKQLKKIV